MMNHVKSVDGKNYINGIFQLIARDYRSFCRFALVGCSNTFVDFAVFTILREIFDVYYLWCQVAGYTFGTLNSFVLNKNWTFESKTSRFQTSMQFGKFIFVNLVSLGASLLGLRLFSGHWHVNVYVAKVAVTAIAQLINYSGYRFWVFDNSLNLNSMPCVSNKNTDNH